MKDLLETRPSAALVAVTLLLALSSWGCAAESSGNTPDGSMPTMDSAMPTMDAGTPPECSDTRPCPNGFICAAVDGVPRCVSDPDPPPPGDGTDCSPCPAPGECREGVCVQPSETGDLCEFDTQCPAGQICIAGRCTPDPGLSQPCEDDDECPFGMICGPDGICICREDVDCPSGLICIEGVCGSDDCVSDADCPGDEICEDGRCLDPDVCRIEHPNLTGTWQLESILRIREALPGWLDGFLSAVDGPFRFLSSADCSLVDFGLPAWVETELCELMLPWVDRYLPAWSRDVFRAVADLNTVLSEWTVQEEMMLEAGTVEDSYRGTHEWQSITMRYRGDSFMGTSGEIGDWRFAPAPFNGSAVCGTFYLERHTVNVSVGAIIAWAVDTLIYEASGRRWMGASDALAEMTVGFCDALATAAESAIEYSGVGDAVRATCRTLLASLADEALRALIDARIGADPITLRGSAPITGPNSMRPGRWDGTLVDRAFSGDFSASR